MAKDNNEIIINGSEMKKLFEQENNTLSMSQKISEEQKCFDSRFDVQIDHSALNTRFKVLGNNTSEREKYVGSVDGIDIYRVTTVKWVESEDCYKVITEDVTYEEVV